MYNDITYKGKYNGKDITINFENTKRGYIKIGNRDRIPFDYKIEKSKVDNGDAKKIKTYVYRFTVDAKYDFYFPFGLYEIGQKRSPVLRANDSLTFVRQ
ncbi:hypothetical protein JCM19294_1516 [Nonlabens tegetincola]|uniref:Uncharacterized protein n=2 Tax=Nonlabens tegetincola TaxID=323273 RepID=A0A090Q7Z8_9FLAO|nr:hypothetical protein JCM19294_1516 [Nonlabens tegetincola]